MAGCSKRTPGAWFITKFISLVVPGPDCLTVQHRGLKQSFQFIFSAYTVQVHEKLLKAANLDAAFKPFHVNVQKCQFPENHIDEYVYDLTDHSSRHHIENTLTANISV